MDSVVLVAVFSATTALPSLRRYHTDDGCESLMRVTAFRPAIPVDSSAH
jgi:hypothetical protein